MTFKEQSCFRDAYGLFMFRDVSEGVVQHLAHTIAFVKCQKV